MKRVFLFFLGSVIASFLHNRIDRKIRKQNYLFSFSRCSHCNHRLYFKDMIPCISYLFLKGKCRYCKKQIDHLCFYSETAGGLIFALYSDPWQIISLSILLSLSLWDIRIQKIPDQELFLLLPVILFSRIDSIRGFRFWIEWIETVSVLLLFVIMTGRIYRKQTMGEGDLILLSVLFLSFELRERFFLLELSCLLALFWLFGKEKDKPFPFVPFIAVSYAVLLIANR